MRTLGPPIRALAVLLTICAISCAPPASQPEAESPAAQPSEFATTARIDRIPDPNARSDNPAFTWEDVDQDPELIGRWFYTASDDGAFTSAAFGGEDTEASFTWVCERASRTISLTREMVLTPDQSTGLGIIIPGARHLLAAQSYNEGLPTISAQVPATDPRLDTIAASAQGFAVQAAGDTTRIRHDEMLARVLADCRR